MHTFEYVRARGFRVPLDGDQHTLTVGAEAADRTPRPSGYRFGCHEFLTSDVEGRLWAVFPAVYRLANLYCDCQ